MESKSKVFWRSVYPLVGSVIGVGIFGLPFAFAQAGFFVGLTHLIVLAIINTVVLLLYADIVMNTKGHPRFTGIVRRYLGEKWSWSATILLIGSIWGAMVAYIIIGGQFLHALIAPMVGGEVTIYSLIFFFVSSLLLIGGLGFISRIEMYFVFVLLLMLFVILVGSLPYFDASQLLEVNTKLWFLPFGVVLFAFGGMAAIPEMAHVLGRHKSMLRRSILVGVAIITVVYTTFAGVIVAVTGASTSEEAVIGLGNYVGNWVLIIGAIIGIVSVFTSFLILGIAVMDTLIYDYKQRYLWSWAVTVVVPLAIFMLGARSFINVIGFSGGLLISLTGLLLIYTYIKAKKDVCTPKRCLQYPNWVLYLAAGVFIFGAIGTILSL